MKRASGAEAVFVYATKLDCRGVCDFAARPKVAQSFDKIARVTSV